MKIAATIEARMTSSRLPGKVLMTADGKPMLTHLVNRLRQTPSLDEIVIATTTNADDDPICRLARRESITAFRGGEDDVMDRVIRAAGSVNAAIVVEITGDCPIIDPAVVEQTIRMFLRNDCDYASNAHVRSYPDGMDVQVFRLATLKRSRNMTDKAEDHEHVTLHIRKHPELFRHVHLVAPADMHWPELGLTLDELKDYVFLKRIIEHFGTVNPFFSCRDVIQLIKQNPAWLSNQDVIRRQPL